MKKKYGFWDALKFLKKYILAHKFHFILFYIGWLMQSIIIVIIPTMFGKMIDEIVYKNNRETFFQIALFVGCLYLGCWIMYFFIYRQHNYLITKFAYQIKQDLLNEFLVIKAEYLVNIEEGELISLFTWYPLECVHLVVRGVLHQFNHIIKIVLIMIVIVRINPLMGALIFMMVVSSIILTKVVGEKTKDQASKLRMQNEKNQSWILEMLSGMTQIKLLSAEPYVKEQLECRSERVFKIRKHTNQIFIKYSNLLLTSRVTFQVFLYAYLAFLAFQDKITIGELTVILSYFTFLTSTITDFYDNWKTSMERIPFVQKINEFLGNHTEEEWTGKEKISEKNMMIQFDHVSFGYGEKNVLNDLSLQLMPGKKIGLVGDSGCGKTTITDLIVGLFEVKKGRIQINNQDIKTFGLESIRERIGLVSQRVSIINGTIRDNLNVVREDASLEEMIQACQYAGIWEYIQTLPEGLDTMLGFEGMELSGGEKQRLSIARIYLKQPQIIIFDESTSALDTEKEKEIMSYWDDILKSRTVIIITHRLSTLSLCDEIYVMKNGRIQEQGELSQLESQETYFSKLFRIKEVQG